MSQPPYPGQPYPGEPSSGQPYQGQPPSQPYPGQPGGDPAQPQYPPTQPYPSSGQPSYGPEYAQPGYGQQPPPGYGQAYPGHEQPGYGQQPPPGYGQPGFPPPTPPKKKSKVLPIVLTSVAIVLVLCVGGVVALYMIGKNEVDKVDDAVRDVTPTSTAAPATPDETEEPATTVQIVEPKTLGGRDKLTDAQFTAVTDQLKRGLSTVPGATNTVGALYGDPADQDIVIVAAAEAPIANPQRELDSTFYGAGVGGLKIDNIQTAPTGALGGAAKCGRSETSNIPMAICTWADKGSVGMFIWYYKSVAKAKSEFPKLRAQVEKVS